MIMMSGLGFVFACGVLGKLFFYFVFCSVVLCLSSPSSFSRLLTIRFPTYLFSFTTTIPMIPSISFFCLFFLFLSPDRIQWLSSLLEIESDMGKPFKFGDERATNTHTNTHTYTVSHFVFFGMNLSCVLGLKEEFCFPIRKNVENNGRQQRKKL